MRVSRSVAGVCFAICAFGQNPASPSPVTDTRRVGTGGGKTELLRKINGRWWSQDNREVYPPSKTGVFWELDSKVGVVDFFHHRPFRLELAESLHLFMQPAEVEAILGQPNRVFGTGDHANWYYHAANGTKLDIRFMGDGLGEAEYEPVTGKSYSVATIERELGGRSIYSVLAGRATQRSKERLVQMTANAETEHAARVEAARASMPGRRGAVQPRVLTVQSATVPAGAVRPPAQKRIVSTEALASVAPGATREEVVARLGEPSYKSTITSDEGTRESLTYHRESGDAVTVRLINGRVTEVRR